MAHQIFDKEMPKILDRDVPQQPSKFADLYKCSGSKTKSGQESRRKECLENIRLSRSQLANQNRGIVGDLNENVGDVTVEAMDTSDSTNHRRYKIEKKAKGNYTNKIMHSEWFSEIPQDLEKNWVAKLCPIGSRRIVLARYKTTLAFNRYGKIVDRFASLLPGGSPNDFDDKPTLLDCIFNHQLKCYFVLDILVWSSNLFERNDSECRFFFLKSKFNEYPELGQRSQFNHRCFFEIGHFCPTRDGIQERMAHQHVIDNQTVFVDGLLFYHKETPYIAGPNPLVGWLKPNMLPDMLNISVPGCYLDEKFCNDLHASRKTDLSKFFNNKNI